MLIAELTRNDVEEIRTIVREEIQHLEKRLDQRMDTMYGLLYVILAGMFALVGFVLWDRRTALAPAIKKAGPLLSGKL